MSWVNECRNKCKLIKHIGQDFIWQEKPNRANYLVASSNLLDNDHQVIPDLYLMGEYRPLKKGRGEIFTIALQFFIKPGELRRVFMLESYPSYIPSHRDKDGQIYGPHVHLGDHRLEQVVKSLHAKEDGLPFSHWAQRFARHAKVYSGANTSGGIPGPFLGDLFG
ncbi:hypothetical protein [Halomonas piscis]|uniref:hypothetical protein n=1 Tax=Halomonas piscis TaxID=3031727 RepID=UPI00289B624F|nr:hypothetical protein [Halomonas piscis]